MRLRTRGMVGRTIAAATAVGVIAAPLALTSTTAQAETAKVPPLKVMTRNLYLGVDILRPLAAVDALPDDAPVTKIARPANLPGRPSEPLGEVSLFTAENLPARQELRRY